MRQVAKKNVLIVVLLLVLLSLLGCILWLAQQDRQAALAYILFPAEQADNIVIERADTTLRFSRSENGWQMLEPLAAAASTQRLNPLLSLLSLPRSHRYSLSDVDPVELGLSPPQASVSINHLEFEFGHSDVSAQKRYLRIRDAVYLIDDLIFALISSPPESFTASTNPASE